MKMIFVFCKICPVQSVQSMEEKHSTLEELIEILKPIPKIDFKSLRLRPIEVIETERCEDNARISREGRREVNTVRDDTLTRRRKVSPINWEKSKDSKNCPFLGPSFYAFFYSEAGHSTADITN